MKRNLDLRKSAEVKRDRIHSLDLANGDPLVNAQVDPELLYTLEEIALLLKSLMSIEAPRDGDGRILEVRPKGHWFEYEVGKRLGYHYPPAAGVFPDIRNQLLEVKHHTGKSVTVDFGRYHPGSSDVIEGYWNDRVKARVRDIRYLIALAPPPDYKVSVLFLATGAEIESIFGVSPTKTIKYQLGISRQWREEHSGQILVSGNVFQW